MGLSAILPVIHTITIDTLINFNGVNEGSNNSRLGYGLGFLSCTETGSRDPSLSLYSVNMFCIIQSCHQVWNLIQVRTRDVLRQSK